MDTVTVHVSRVSPTAAASIDDLRQTFITLFQRDIFETVYHFEQGGQTEGLSMRSRSELALQHVAYQPKVKSLLREIEHFYRVGVVKLDVKVGLFTRYCQYARTALLSTSPRRKNF